MTQAGIETALLDADARKAAVEAQYAALTQQMTDLQKQAVSLNAQGIELEKTLLGIEGERKALMALLAVSE